MSIITIFIGLLSIFSVSINDINVEDQYIYDNKIFTYGSFVDSDNDGVLIVNDIDTNEEVFRFIYDDHHHEYFKYLAVISEDEYLLVCEKYSDIDGLAMPTFLETELIKIDCTGTVIDTIVLNEKYKSYYNHGYQLILQESDNTFVKINRELKRVEDTMTLEFTKEFIFQFRGEAFVNGEFTESIYIYQPGYYQVTIIENEHSFIYNVTINPELYLIGEKQNDYFVSSVKIISSSIVYVNDDVYLVNTLFDEPGIYEIKVYGENDYIYTETFLIIPIITYSTQNENYDFIDGIVVNEPITISSNATSMYLNGHLYNSEIIDEINDYELVIYGVNHMQYRLSFSILPSVTGLTNNTDYESVDFCIYGQALLNGEIVTGDVHIAEQGDYVLELMFKGDVSEKYYFSIISNDISGESTHNFNFNYIFGFIIVIGIVLFYRKK